MKIILSILIMFLVNIDVSAKEYYSEYKEFTDYSLEEVVPSDIVNVEIKKVYNKYYKVFVGDFYLHGENPSWYPYINSTKYKDTEFSNWSEEYPGDKYNRVIESRKICEDNDCLKYHLEFRYKDRLYYYFGEQEKKLDGNIMLNGYIKDINDCTTYYRYQSRDKIEIDDDIIITNKNQSINDFISSTTYYKIIGDIDYSKNGIYKIEIETYFNKIPISINVLIKDNIDNFYNKILNNKNELIDKLNLEIINNNINLEEQKNLLDKTNKELFTLEKNLELNNNDNLKLMEVNQSLENEINNYNDKIKFLNNKSLKLNEQLDYKDNTIEQLENKLIFMSNKIDRYVQKNISLNDGLQAYEKTNNELKKTIINYENELLTNKDIEKKLNLCNQNNSNLNVKLEYKSKINKRNLFFILFINIIILLISCCLLKIKSIKKNN